MSSKTLAATAHPKPGRLGQPAEFHGSRPLWTTKPFSVRVLWTYDSVDTVVMRSTLGSPISVRLPQELRERIAVLARATRRSQGDVVREVLERDLASLEWELRIADRAAAHRAGLVQAVPAEEVDRQLDIAGDPPEDALGSVS